MHSSSNQSRHLTTGLITATTLACLMATSCIGKERLKAWASPHVACSTDSMDIQQIDGEHYTTRYDVACNTGEVYRCSSRAGSALGGAATRCELVGGVEFADEDSEPSQVEVVRHADQIADAQWHRVHFEECAASVLMPGNATAKAFTSHGQPGHAAVLETSGHEFGFFCFDLSSIGPSVTEDQLASKMLDGIVGSTGAKLVRVEHSEAALDFVLKVDEGHQRGQIQIRNDWGYMALSGPMEGLAPNAVSKFVSSIEIGTPVRSDDSKTTSGKRMSMAE